MSMKFLYEGISIYAIAIKTEIESNGQCCVPGNVFFHHYRYIHITVV